MWAKWWLAVNFGISVAYVPAHISALELDSGLSNNNRLHFLRSNAPELSMSKDIVRYVYILNSVYKTEFSTGSILTNKRFHSYVFSY